MAAKCRPVRVAAEFREIDVYYYVESIHHGFKILNRFGGLTLHNDQLSITLM